jgi:hypothetical protein
MLRHIRHTALKMEARNSSEVLVTIFHNIGHYISEDDNFQEVMLTFQPNYTRTTYIKVSVSSYHASACTCIYVLSDDASASKSYRHVVGHISAANRMFSKSWKPLICTLKYPGK